MMSHTNRKAVVQLVRDLNAKGLRAKFVLQQFSEDIYHDTKRRHRAFLVVQTAPRSLGQWSFTSRNYKTNEDIHTLFEEREAKTLLNDVERTLAQQEKILSGQPIWFSQYLKLLFNDINDVFISKETLVLKALVSGITDEEAENFGVKEGICY